MNILFVCTGNTCRSSMAEGILKKYLEENNIENIYVSSAGISAFQGQKANEKAVNVLSKKGIDISSHKSRQLTEEILKDSDIILTMTNAHKNIILQAVPDISDKVYTLKEYAYIINSESIEGLNVDIEDPYGMDYSVYEQCAEEIKHYINRIINKINNTNE